MTDTDRAEQATDDRDVVETKPACVALVPITPSAPSSRPSSLPRPSSVFVTHLIATATQAPQTRKLRRATPADAESAYSAKPHAFSGACARTRQII
jgi:hypothetical protein